MTTVEWFGPINDCLKNTGPKDYFFEIFGPKKDCSKSYCYIKEKCKFIYRFIQVQIKRLLEKKLPFLEFRETCFLESVRSI